MILAELLQTFAQLAVSDSVPTGIARECASNCSFAFDGMPLCPGSSFTAIGAAFSTQGYFAQADLLFQLTHTNLGLWAPLLYILAALGGFVSLSMGMPPKMYLWFFMGPGIYHYLLDTTVPALGTSWCVANIAQDQTEVWKLAEVGLKNSNIVALSQAGDYNGEGPIEIAQYAEPSSPVQVSHFFLWFDSVVSSTVQWMTVWTGVYQQRGGDSSDSGIIQAPNGTETRGPDQYYLMSKLKWPMLDRITSARLHSGELRDVLATFMNSECGDALARSIEPGNLVAASNSKTGDLPYSIFRGVTPPDSSSGAGAGGSCSTSQSNDRDYSLITKNLANQLIPIPRTVRSAWWNPERSSAGSATSSNAHLRGTLPGFYQNYNFGSYPYSPRIPSFFFFGSPWHPSFVPNNNDPVINHGGKQIDTFLENQDNISCADLLFFTVNGFRWEAGQIYYQLVSTAPMNMDSDQVIFNLFYGWDLKNQCGEKLNTEGLRNYLTDLILIHLIRNEMAMLPKVTNSRFLSQSNSAANAGNRSIAESGAKAKFGEVYTWALMMPYVQGVLMYLLAMAYPFVCVMIVVPGWHKTLFTWMAFWTWVKLWDLGFAVVLVLERSIWAILGNNTTAQALSPRIAEMQQWGKVGVDLCSRRQGGSCPIVPMVVDGMSVNGADGLQAAWKNLLAIFDRAMMVGTSIDVDIQNGYYIYIMSALYFAVPAVCGQLVLGAKAGAASMATNLAQGAQDAGGRAAQSQFTGQMKQFGAANAASQNQAQLAKGYRTQGLADQAIAASNAAAAAGLEASQFGEIRGGYGNLASINSMNSGNAHSNLKAGTAYMNLATNPDGLKALGIAAATSWAQSQTSGQSAGGPPSGGGGAGGNLPSPGGSGSGGGGAAPNGGSAPTLPGGRGGAAPSGGASAAQAAQGYAAIWGASQFVSDPDKRANLMKAFNEAVGTAGDNFITRGFNQRAAGYTAAQADASIGGFGAQARKSANEGLNQRMNAQANFGAESAAWEARMNYANDVSGYFGALGIENPVSPGQKPTDMMGMAMSGMLGSSTQQAASYFNVGGAYQSAAQSAQSQLQWSFGGGAIMGSYQTGSPGSELGQAWGGFRNTLPGKAQIDDVIQNPGNVASLPLSGNWNAPTR